MLLKRDADADADDAGADADAGTGRCEEFLLRDAVATYGISLEGTGLLDEWELAPGVEAEAECESPLTFPLVAGWVVVRSGRSASVNGSFGDADAPRTDDCEGRTVRARTLDVCEGSGVPDRRTERGVTTLEGRAEVREGPDAGKAALRRGVAAVGDEFVADVRHGHDRDGGWGVRDDGCGLRGKLGRALMGWDLRGCADSIGEVGIGRDRQGK